MEEQFDSDIGEREILHTALFELPAPSPGCFASLDVDMASGRAVRWLGKKQYLFRRFDRNYFAMFRTKLCGTVTVLVPFTVPVRVFYVVEVSNTGTIAKIDH